MRWYHRTFFILLLTQSILFFGLNPLSAESWDLTDFFPLGANLVQIIPSPNFDYDDEVEYLCLYSLEGRLGVTLLDRKEDGRYVAVFHKTLGKGDPRTGGRVRFADTSYTYRILQVADLNGNGVLEFWTLFQPENSPRAEMAMYKYENRSYFQAFVFHGQYDLQFIDYDGELIIHGVFAKDNEDGRGEEVLEIKSATWDYRRNQLLESREGYQISKKDYLSYARCRWRPKFFSQEKKTKDFLWSWGNSKNKVEEIPLGERAIKPLLPANTLSIVEIISDSAFDQDIDEEHIVTYLVPDDTDDRRVLMLAALVDWDFERSQYQLVPLPFKAYGLARDPEGYFFRTVYVIPGNGLKHLALLGNGERLSSLTLSILNNNGFFFEEAEVFSSTYHLQFLENYTLRGVGYEMVTADLQADGRIKVTVRTAVPEGAYAKIGPFQQSLEEVISCRDYKRLYYRGEEPILTTEGYEWQLLSTNHPEINPFSLQAPETDYQGRLDDYIFKYMTPFRIHQWYVKDLDQDEIEEALLLIRIDKDYWAWPPKYRLGLLFRDEKLRLESIGYYPLQIGDGNPVNGVYFADLTGDGQNELIIFTRGFNLETNKNQVYLEILKKEGGFWKKIRKGAWYDDQRIYKIGDELWLYGYDGAEKAVYGLIWKGGRFSYQEKEITQNFSTFLWDLPEEKIDFLSEEYRIFPLHSREIMNGGSFTLDEVESAPVISGQINNNGETH